MACGPDPSVSLLVLHTLSRVRGGFLVPLHYGTLTYILGFQEGLGCSLANGEKSSPERCTFYSQYAFDCS